MNPEPYDFLFNQAGRPLVDELIEFRETVDDLPETMATFRGTEYMDQFTARAFSRRPKLLYLVESWNLPEWFPGGETGSKPRFINPTAPGIKRYSMAGSKCACGNYVTDIVTNTPVDEVHAGGCTPADRRALRSRVKDIRIRRALIGAHLQQPHHVIAKSIGVHKRDVSMYYVPYDWDMAWKVGKRRMAATFDEIADCGYTQREIAEAFGINQSTVWDYVNRRRFDNTTSETAKASD